MVDLKHFRIEDGVFESPALRGNPAGDPWQRRLPVLVPRGWSAGTSGASGGPYPVVVFLSGFAGSGLSFLNWKSWSPTLPERLDRLRENGSIGDIIAVFPDAFTVYGGSQYLNSTATGRYEDMIVDDLTAWLDERYPTLATAAHRAVVGKSSGGYGALRLGMRRPDVFSAVACHSGDIYFEYGYAPDFPRLLRQLEKYGGLEGFMDAFFAAPKKTSDLVLSMNIVAMAAAYSPAPERPWRVELPMDPETGEIRQEVWSRWLANDPVRMVEQYGANLRKLRCLFLDCGRRDQFHLQYGLRILRKRLESLGLPHEAEEFDDDHSDTAYRYDVSLPRIWEAIRPDARP